MAAFNEKDRALLFLKDIEALIIEHGYKFNIRLAESENEVGLLHKIWIGPINEELHGYALREILEGAGIEKPVKVEVE